MVNLDKLFYPKSICLIGVSDVPIKGATSFLYALKKIKCEIPIYCVGRKNKVLFDMKAYPSILDVPEEIDYCIIGVPRKDVPKAVKECGEKGVKFATIFTAGFSETGTEEGKNLEFEILQNANGTRLVGPNCLGPYCRESKVTMTEVLEEPEGEGEVAFVSQSGGHTGAFYDIGEHRGFHFNKVVSLGNQLDLKLQDFIDYFAQDTKIKVISCYVEQVKKAKEFLTILKKSSRIKPIIFWKGGRTKQGIIAASSHTGAISSSYEIFKSAIIQNGGLIAESIEELADLTLGSLMLQDKKLSRNLGIVVPGGGSCVEMTDEAAKFGFNIPQLTSETREKIQSQIQDINTSTRNPVDLGVLGWIPQVFSKTIQYTAEDPNVDILIFYFMLERLPNFEERLYDPRLGMSFLNRFKRAAKKSDKPFVCIIPNFIISDEKIANLRYLMFTGLSKLKIPYFSSMSRAVNVINKLIRYQEFKNK